MTEAISVADLIKDLEAVEDKSLPVLVEGCDCINECTGVRSDYFKSRFDPSLDSPNPAVLITCYNGVES